MALGYAVAVLIGAGSLAVALQESAPSSGPVAALFPPWWSQSQTLAAAANAGAFVRYGSLPFVAVVAPQGPHLRERLSAAGAWLTLSPLALGGCGSSARRPASPTSA